MIVAMINMPDRPYVAVRLVAVKLLFAHGWFLLGCYWLQMLAPGEQDGWSG